MRPERCLSTLLQCLEWYKRVLHTFLPISAMLQLANTQLLVIKPVPTYYAAVIPYPLIF